MTEIDQAPPVHLSIGEVLAFIQEEFPEVTISKIRFLESQGLIQPDRTASGYRKFYESDIERLQWILRQQRDHFLPLKVIRKMLDEGVDRFDPGGGDQPTLWTPSEDEELPEPEPAAVSSGPPRSRAHPAVASAPAERSGSRRSDTVATAPRVSRRDEDRSGSRADEQPFKRPSEPIEPAVVGAAAESAPPTPDAGSSPPPGDGRDQASRPPLETPADVVAALQEDPRTARRSGGTGGSGGRRDQTADVAAPTSGTGRKPSSPQVDPDTELSSAELCRDAGIDEALLAGLEQFGLVQGQFRSGERVYGPDALVVARLAARYAELGVEPRHLRMYLVSAEREAGFVEQLAVPFLKQRNPQARSQALELASELATMGADLHRALLQRGLGPDLLP